MTKNAILIGLNTLLLLGLFYYAFQKDMNSNDALDFLFWIPSLLLIGSLFVLNWIFYLQLKPENLALAKSLRLNALLSLITLFLSLFMGLFGV